MCFSLTIIFATTDDLRKKHVKTRKVKLTDRHCLISFLFKSRNIYTTLNVSDPAPRGGIPGSCPPQMTACAPQIKTVPPQARTVPRRT